MILENGKLKDEESNIEMNCINKPGHCKPEICIGADIYEEQKYNQDGVCGHDTAITFYCMPSPRTIFPKIKKTSTVRILEMIQKRRTSSIVEMRTKR